MATSGGRWGRPRPGAKVRAGKKSAKNATMPASVKAAGTASGSGGGRGRGRGYDHLNPDWDPFA